MSKQKNLSFASLHYKGEEDRLHTARVWVCGKENDGIQMTAFCIWHLTRTAQTWLPFMQEVPFGIELLVHLCAFLIILTMSSELDDSSYSGK